VSEQGLEFVAPRYSQACITDVLPSVCDGLGLPGAFDILGLGTADVVAVVVIDGLGARQLARYGDEVPFLAKAVRQELTSVFPSTTAAGLTSIGTGLPPGEHGLVGASFRLAHDNHLLRPLSWSQDPNPRVVQGEPTWWARANDRGVEVSIVSPRAYKNAGLTHAALGGARYLGADGPGERAEVIAEEMTGGGRRLVYGYWEWLDKTAHMRGVASAGYLAELEAVELFLKQVVAKAPAGSRVIATADHGVLDCPDVVDMDEIPDLHQAVRLIAGEPRMRHVYVAPGQQNAVAQRYAAALGERAQVLTRAQALGAGVFGPVAADNEVRLGDVIVLATGRNRLACPSRDRIVSGLLGQHGSLTAEEMMVPLAVWDV
jgi:hypothetical protein